MNRKTNNFVVFLLNKYFSKALKNKKIYLLLSKEKFSIMIKFNILNKIRHIFYQIFLFSLHLKKTIKENDLE